MSQVITTTDLDDYTSSSLDMVRADLVVDAVNAWIETRTGRCWGETKQATQRYGYTRTIWLRRMDIQSIDEVSLGIPGQQQQILSPNDYYINDLGRLTFVGSVPRHTGSPLLSDYVGVKYTYGQLDVPDDLVHAALGIAAGFYNWAQSENKDVVETQVGSYRVRYADSGKAGPGQRSGGGNTVDSLFAVIESYKVRRV